MSKVLGAATPSEYRRGVIGAVERSATGNTILRVGALLPSGVTWEQTEHVVLTPGEREELIARLMAESD